mmetsp:Transcript_22993/g.36727  ORF Transcript_22993/g.36727 Transcript_22993/m.36727 type:complete len:107 (-) Transcript_22993:99-419(-)
MAFRIVLCGLFVNLASCRVVDPKEGYCVTHEQELVLKIDDAKKKLREEESQLDHLKARGYQCNGHCEDYTKIQLEISHAENDVQYQKDRVANLQDQLHHLRSWCST